MQFVFFVVGCILAVQGCVLAAPATYDQRQTGDLNVQIHLKDLKVLALVDSELLDDYTEYDYFYDYADFTVKPTAKPGNSTSKPWSTWPTNPTSSPSSSSSAAASSTATLSLEPATGSTTEAEGLQNPPTIDNSPLAENATADSANSPSKDNEKPEETTAQPVVNDASEDNAESVTASVTAMIAEKRGAQQARKRCRSGFEPDGKGRCRRLHRRRLSLLPIAVKLAPQLLQDTTHTAKRS